MEKTFIVANWKSNKTETEAENWLSQVSSLKDQDLSNKEIIILPSFTLLPIMKAYIEKNMLPIKLGSQDISPFCEGAYTGEVNGKQIKDFAEYVLIGHSERKRCLGETWETIQKKVQMANRWNLKVIFCGDGSESIIPDGLSILTYEPPSCISPAPADTPENAEKAAKMFQAKNIQVPIMYGGNVTAENANSFLKIESIRGVLVGRASLDPLEFLEIIKNA